MVKIDDDDDMPAPRTHITAGGCQSGCNEYGLASDVVENLSPAVSGSTETMEQLLH